jgi:AmmeMemoRadiSam system protein A
MPPLQHNSSAPADSSHRRVESLDTATATATAQDFSHEERSLLLRLAHDSICSALQRLDISADSPCPHLNEHRGVFTSLYLRGELRGCVGYVLPTCPLYRAVVETARAAAFDDNRFPPVSADEAPHLEIELSILSHPQTVPAEAVEVGRHGLLIALHGRRGLLLPQVAVEHSWDRTTFLDQTCRKAGLPLDAWRTGANIQTFTAEVFGDKKHSAPDL